MYLQKPQPPQTKHLLILCCACPNEHYMPGITL